MTKEIFHEDFNILITTNEDAGNGVVLTVYKKVCNAKVNKALINGRAANEEIAMKALNKFLAAHEERKQRKAKLIEERKAVQNPFSVGDIFYDSWGYEQTNIDFYQVIEVKKRSIVVRRIYSQSAPGKENGGDWGYVIPAVGKFKMNEKPFLKQITVRAYSDSFSVKISGLVKWDGKPMYYSSYH